MPTHDFDAPPETAAKQRAYQSLRESHTMSAADVSKGLAKSEAMRDMAAALLRQTKITPDDVFAHLGAMVGKGMLTAAEAIDAFSRMPPDASQARPAIERLYQDAVHVNQTLQAEGSSRAPVAAS